MDKKYEKISQDLGVTLKQIDTVLSLTAEGATIPFIARYRKDMTGSLDEVTIKAIIDLDKSLTNLNGNMQLLWITVIVNQHLCEEVRIIVISIDFQHLISYWNVEIKTRSIVPSNGCAF